MFDCGCGPTAVDAAGQQRVLKIALVAAHRGLHFKSNAETASGALLLALGVFVLGEAVMRVRSGEAPDGMLMIGVAALAAVVNMAVLRLLSRYRDDGVHIRATWIFVGTAIGIYVCKEAVEILRVARAAQR